MKTVIVGGGTGNVGEGIVRAFLEANYRVIVPTRSAAKAEQLAQWMSDASGDLRTLVVDISKATAAREAVLGVVGEADALVASLGGWWQGAPLVGVRPETWHHVMDTGLNAHYHFARAFVPLLKRGPSSSYTLINGFSAEQPYPNASLSSISAAAQLMMARNLMEELKGRHRVNTLVLGPVISRSRPSGNPDWITAVDAGHAAVEIAANPGADAEIYRLDTVEDLGKVKRVSA